MEYQVKDTFSKLDHSPDVMYKDDFIGSTDLYSNHCQLQKLLHQMAVKIDQLEYQLQTQSQAWSRAQSHLQLHEQ